MHASGKYTPSGRKRSHFMNFRPIHKFPRRQRPLNSPPAPALASRRRTPRGPAIRSLPEVNKVIKQGAGVVEGEGVARGVHRTLWASRRPAEARKPTLGGREPLLISLLFLFKIMELMVHLEIYTHAYGIHACTECI